MTVPETPDALATLRQKLQQLKALHEEGTLSAEAYASAKAPLERELLDLVVAQAPGAGAAAAAPAQPSKRLLGGVSVAVLVLAVAGYAGFGSPGLPSAGAPGSAAPAEAAQDMTEAQFIAAVEQLATRMAQEPGNAEGWGLLARSYARLGRHADAVAAFAKAVAIVGDDPSLLVDYADALAMTQDRVLEGQPLALVERALKADPNNGKALALAGTAAFNRKDYAGAARQWERLAQVSPPDSPFLAQLQSSIDEARSLGGLPPGPRIAQAAPAATAAPATGAASGAAAAPAAALTGTVRLSPALAAQARPDDVVFIFARPAEGARMPLAILRHQVKDLPVSFRLDDSMAMSPAMKLSQFDKVVVSARVSKSGQAAPAAGDLSGQSAPVGNQAQGLVIEINEVVKP
jgi:cytochrome c-type biogenesis protein CcmH